MENQFRNIFAVIVTYSPSLKVRCNIQAILEQGVFVVIVENSTELNIDFLQYVSGLPSVMVIQNSRNIGVSAALNLGIRYSRSCNAEWVFTFDQDSCVSPGFLKTMVLEYERAEKKFGKLALVAPSYCEQADVDQVEPELFSDENLALRNWVITSGNLLRPSLFDTSGYFDEDFFIDCIDVDFGLRVRKLGYSIVQTKNTYLLHNLGEKTRHSFYGKKPVVSNHSYQRRYTIMRNKIYVYKRYMIFDVKWFLKDFRDLVVEFIKMCLFEKNRIQKIRSVLLGIRDAFLSRKGPYQYDKQL